MTWLARLVLALLLIQALAVAPAAQSAADESERPCSGTGGVYGGKVRCEYSASEVRVLLSDQSEWKYLQGPQVCKRNAPAELCYNPQDCQANGVTGTWYLLDRAPVNAPADAFEPYGVFCVTADDEYDFRAVTKRRVTEKFKAVTWPQADLVVQPPDGRTLVNFPTNFYTNLTEPVVEPVDIFGHTVEIEATPSSYTWHWSHTSEGGDSASEQTTHSGAPYVEGQELEVSHEYTDAEVTVHPSVDVTYTGRYRVDGGDWQTIDETLTVAGTPVPLEVIEARVHLVG